MTWVPASLGDAAALAALFNRIADFEETPERFSPEAKKHDLDSDFRPLEQRTIVGRLEPGDVIAYGVVYHRRSEAEEQRAHFAVYVSPDWRGRGLEDAITDWALSASGDVLEEVAASQKYVCSWLYKNQEEAEARLESRGFAAGRHWWEMERLLNEDVPSSPEDGFTIVPWGNEHSMPVRVVCNTAFADHWGFSPFSEESWQRQSIESPRFRQHLSFVALAGDKLVGYSYNLIQEEDWEAAGRSEGWIAGLGVLSEWRKKGIATALLSRSMQVMKDAGLDAAMIGVDSASPTGAQHLYYALGFRTQITGTTWQRPYPTQSRVG